MSRLRVATILDAADRWKQCLLDGGSLFDEETLWTSEHFAELHRHFVERPAEGSRSFEEKHQLEPASPQATRLWAEITWVYYLLVISVKPVTKLDRIRRVYQWSGTELSEDHWALGEDLGRGLVHPGIGFAAHQWREFRFIVTLMCDWTSRSATDRQALLRDPWEFAKWVDAQPDGPDANSAMHCCSVFPDQFEPIMSISNKRAIVTAFRDQTGDRSDVDDWTDWASTNCCLQRENGCRKPIQVAKSTSSTRRSGTLGTSHRLRNPTTIKRSASMMKHGTVIASARPTCGLFLLVMALVCGESFSSTVSLRSGGTSSATSENMIPGIHPRRVDQERRGRERTTSHLQRGNSRDI